MTTHAATPHTGSGAAADLSRPPGVATFSLRMNGRQAGLVVDVSFNQLEFVNVGFIFYFLPPCTRFLARLVNIVCFFFVYQSVWSIISPKRTENGKKKIQKSNIFVFSLMEFKQVALFEEIV